MDLGKHRDISLRVRMIGKLQKQLWDVLPLAGQLQSDNLTGLCSVDCSSAETALELFVDQDSLAQHSARRTRRVIEKRFETSSRAF